jgi:hypothetical protein
MLILALLFASAVTLAQQGGVRAKPQHPRSAPVQFRCGPNVVSSADTLTLTFSSPHGPELGVRTPDQQFLFIAFVQETPQSVPPVRGEVFAKMRSLKLSVKGATGLDHIGSSEPRAIFSVPGTYRFILADNLETEADFGGHQACDVRFAPTGDTGGESGRARMSASSRDPAPRPSRRLGPCRIGSTHFPSTLIATALWSSSRRTPLGSTSALSLRGGLTLGYA